VVVTGERIEVLGQVRYFAYQ